MLIVRNKDGIVVWSADPHLNGRTGCSYSIEGGGTVVVRDRKGKVVTAYKLKPGETVEAN